jgi:hypothetical protein
MGWFKDPTGFPGPPQGLPAPTPQPEPAQEPPPAPKAEVHCYAVALVTGQHFSITSPLADVAFFSVVLRDRYLTAPGLMIPLHAIAFVQEIPLPTEPGAKVFTLVPKDDAA